MRIYFNLSAFYLVIGLISGVFYREFTKLSGFEGDTILSTLHTHVLVLGFLFFLVLLLIEKNFGFSKIKTACQWLIFHNIAFIYFIGTIVTRGILDVQGIDFNGLSHIAGLGHALMAISFIWFLVIGNKMLKQHV